MSSTPNPTILRNKGVPVELACVERVEGDDGSVSYSIVEKANGDPRTEKVFVKVDMNVLAGIEERWGTTQEFQEAMAARQNLTLRDLFALILDVEPKVAGLRMIPENNPSYATAVGVALSIANGVDPTRAAQVLEIGVKAADEAGKARDEAMDKVLAEAMKKKEDPSTGSPSSANGSAPDDPSESSGA